MTAHYEVAGHRFSLTLPDSCSLWSRLGQYEPFAVTEGSGCDELFSLELVRTLDLSGPRELLFDAPTEDGQTVVKLFRQGDSVIFEMSPDHNRPCCATLVSTEDYRSARLCLSDNLVSDALFGINNSLMLLFAFTTAAKGTLEMHASMVSNSGKAFLFMAKSGTGKSTHSNLWLKHVPGTELMNDDNPVVRVWPDGRVVAYGSPWSGKTPCYRKVEAPVGAFVRIRRSDENLITRLPLLESYALLYSSCSGFKGDRAMSDGQHASIEAAVTTVPCYVLDCRPDEEAAAVCSKELLG